MFEIVIDGTKTTSRGKVRGEKFQLETTGQGGAEGASFEQNAVSAKPATY